MASMKRPRLHAVRAIKDYILELTFTDQRIFQLDMQSDIHHWPGLAPLRDKKAFMTACLGDNGWTVEWPAWDIQIGADTLLLDALAQTAEDANTRIFLQWRAQAGLPVQAAANALGVPPRTISRYSSGREPVPRHLALACLGVQSPQASVLQQ